MRFDREKLETIAALPDEKLWAEVVRIAGMYGYSLPKETPPHAEIEKMRVAVRSDKINVSESMKLVNQYKKK